jgi:hypothetical protein
LPAKNDDTVNLTNDELWRGSLSERRTVPLGCEAAPNSANTFLLTHRIRRYYDGFAAERDGAAFRQAPSPQWFSG